MNKIIVPLEPGMQGEDVAILHEALLFLLKKNLLILSREQHKRIDRYADREVDASIYGRATAELVRIVQHKYRLEENGVVDETTAETINTILKEFENKDSALKLVGLIKNQYADEGPATGLVVKAYDKDLRSEEFLGETITNQNGKYEISYSRQMFRSAEKNNADLFIRVYAEDKPDQILAESLILFNAPEAATIDLTLESKLSEYERLFNTLSPLLQEAEISSTDLTEEDIDFLVHESGFEALILQVFVAAARITLESSIDIDMSHYEITALFYALGRKGEHLKFPELLNQDFSELRNKLNEAIEEKLIPARFSKLLDIFFKELDRLYTIQ